MSTDYSKRFETWEGQQEIYSQIRRDGMQAYVNKLGDVWRDAFADKKEMSTIGCMDEGIQTGVRSAGSLIMISPEDRVDFCLRILNENGCDKVTIDSHEHCGAAAVKYKESLSEGGLDLPDAMSPDKIDRFTVDATKQIVDEINLDERLKGKVIYGRHISSEEMSRPSDRHIARVIYYDGSGRFSPDETNDLLPGFVISRRYQKLANAIEEVTLALGIAFGGHGFGQRFTSREPVLIVVIGDGTHNEDFSINNLTSELREFVDKLDGDLQGRVDIDTCTMS
jgi:hypothetical protein